MSKLQHKQLQMVAGVIKSIVVDTIINTILPILPTPHTSLIITHTWVKLSSALWRFNFIPVGGSLVILMLVSKIPCETEFKGMNNTTFHNKQRLKYSCGTRNQEKLLIYHLCTSISIVLAASQLKPIYAVGERLKILEPFIEVDIKGDFPGL